MERNSAWLLMTTSVIVVSSLKESIQVYSRRYPKTNAFLLLGYKATNPLFQLHSLPLFAKKSWKKINTPQPTTMVTSFQFPTVKLGKIEICIYLHHSCALIMALLKRDMHIQSILRASLWDWSSVPDRQRNYSQSKAPSKIFSARSSNLAAQLYWHPAS